jgi:hypothetical protein
MGKRGQNAIETLIILAVILAIFTMMLVVNQDVVKSYNSKFTVDRTNSALNDITNAAQSVYQQGVGAKTRVVVNFPDGIANVTFRNNIVKFRLDSNNLIQKKFEFNVSGKLVSYEGRRWVNFESSSNTSTIFVNISDEI